MAEALDVNVVWAPQPGAQEALVHCPITLIGFGGARGGGKTDGVLGKFAIKQEQLGQDFNAIFFRKELPQADDLIERAKQIYLPLKAHYQDQKKQFTFLGGGRLRFRPLANDADAEKFMGQNLSDCAIEEAGNYADPSPIWKLFGCMRGKGNGQIILTFNPGGIGHGWLKALFIKPAPKGMKLLKKDLPNGASFDYIYIPSRVTDNQILLARDPDYINRLHMVGSPELVRAWLEGDFEIHEGSYFPEFSSKHIISPFNVPKHWPRYMGYDWGYHSPFAAVWGAVSSGRTDDGKEVPYPKGSIIIYRELWGKGVDNVTQAERIAALSVGEMPICAADPSIFNNQGGPTINDQFNTVFSKYKHPSFRQADNDRISGWSQIRQRLTSNPPLLYFFATCPYLLETLPSMSIDKQKPEDLDSKGNDHACLAADTLIITDTGPCQIQHLCNGMPVNVLAHDGYYHKAWGALTRKNAEVVKVIFDDNTEVICTPDHKFMLENGSFKEADWAHWQTSVDLIRCVTYDGKGYFRDDTRVQRCPILPLWKLLLLAAKGRSWLKTIAQKSLGILQWRNSQRNAHPSQGQKQGQQPDRQFRITGLQNSPKRPYDARTTTSSSAEYSYECSSSSGTMAQVWGGATMALYPCKEGGAEYALYSNDVPVLQQGVSNQTPYEAQIKVLPPKLQNERKTKKIKAFSYHVVSQDVYCLNVPTASTFVLANGVVSHNCDALRYLCKTRLIDSKWEEPEQVLNRGMVKLQSYISKVRARNKRAQI